MPDGGERSRHLTEALGGRAGAPLSDEDRLEGERVRDLIQAVAACYNTLVSRETGTSRSLDLVARRSFYDGEFRRRAAMTAAERAEVIRSYPELLARLRAEIDR
ncbi:allophanate hydrolase subunit 2 [Kribbella aluminosa]|uniref:Allophanate hydrolase subunit 2 n=1 Tax=Kribbella aluminosa TaxID=416017 RepID=A0ABS4UH97_9ACTN|nr:hypothetical protein [Kribbella aluminosa]MBP2351019.1 allophanate hydrolase subunit 2 [Kribbella aluminosa]